MRSGLCLLKPLVSSIRLAANSANSSSEWYCLVGNEMGTNLGDGVDTLTAPVSRITNGYLLTR